MEIRRTIFVILSGLLLIAGSVFVLFAEEMSASSTQGLELRVDDKLGYKIKCNPDWGLKAEDNSVLFITSDEPYVVISINKSEDTGRSLDQLTIPVLQEIGRYAKDFQIRHTKIAGYDAVNVKGAPQGYPDTRVSDYYIIKDGYLYSLLFSVSPKEEWETHTDLFDEMLASFQFVSE